VSCKIDRVWYAQLLGAAGVSLILIGGSALADLAGPPRIVDGDTLEVAGQRVRLFGIDAPELDQLCQRAGRDYHCGQVARAALWDLIGGADVSCQPEGATLPQDGVIGATCRAGGASLNEGMVHSGWALVDPQAGDRYLPLQADAEQAHRGLWRGEFEPPWEWRQAPAAGRPDG
jgi:endonuclease YncB( thermonuclease family)